MAGAGLVEGALPDVAAGVALRASGRVLSREAIERAIRGIADPRAGVVEEPQQFGGRARRRSMRSGRDSAMRYRVSATCGPVNGKSASWC